VRNCSPTLAGIKTGNLFSCPYESLGTLVEDISNFNLVLNSRGVYVALLRLDTGKALLYVFRPDRLARDLRKEDAALLLQDKGYDPSSSEQCICRLSRRLEEETEFPHEIGLFLGYPPADVSGFIENRGRNCKCTGCWKVYFDEQNALRLFERYHKCTEVYCHLWRDGFPLSRLAIRQATGQQKIKENVLFCPLAWQNQIKTVRMDLYE